MYRTGQPLYLKDLNCHCYDPTHDQVLNPAAWANPVAGTYGPGPSGLTSLLYTDFRGQRRPSESFNILRSFKIGRGDRPKSLSIRADFANIFNRAFTATPTSTNPSLTGNPTANLTKNAAGQYTAGFGVINEVFATGTFPSAANVLPRTGTLVARFNF